MQTFRFVFLGILTLFGGLYLLYLGYLYYNQAGMVFVANKLPKDYQFQFQGNFEELNIPSYDGAKINGLIFKTPKPKGLIFYLHGNSGSLDGWGCIAKDYNDLGYDIFILDYRGFGKSEGEIEDENQVFQDVSYAYDAILKRYNHQKIVIIGYSIGTGMASYLASIKNPDKLILQAPFYNFLEFSSGIAPFVPNFLKKFRFETNLYLPKVKSEISIFHGKDDSLINYNNSIRLQKLLKPTDKVFILENQDHLEMNQNTDFKDKLKTILDTN